MNYFINFTRKIVKKFNEMDQLTKMVFLSLFSGIVILGIFFAWQYVGEQGAKKTEISQTEGVTAPALENSLEVPTSPEPINNTPATGELRVDSSEGVLVDGLAQIVGGGNPGAAGGGDLSSNQMGQMGGSENPMPEAPPSVGPEEKPSSNDNKTESNSNSNNSSSNTNTNTDTSVTPASVDSPTVFSFGVLGDTQQFDSKNESGGLQKAVKNLSSANVEAVMTVGDLISKCDGGTACQSKYTDWKSVMSPIIGKTKEVMGNHDRFGKEKADAKWQEAFDLPTNGPTGFSETTYSFDVKNSHFVVLNSENPSEGLINQVQRDWLETDLTSTTKDNTFVFYHEPAWPVSSKIGESQDRNPTDRDALWAIFKKHNVKAVFSGHEHIMSRKKVDGIYQFVIGNTDSFDHDKPKAGVAEYSYVGKHYAIVKVNGKKVTVNVYSVEGELLKGFDFGN